MVLDILNEKVKRDVKSDLYGIKGELCEYQALKVPTNSFVITLPEEYRTLSTRYAFKKVRHIFNTFVPEGLWDFMHNDSRHWKDTYGVLMEEALREYELGLNDIVFLSTGVTMENIVRSVEEYQDLWVVCFTSAGVKSNAMRIGVDKASGIERNGQFEKIGTINNIVITNACLDDAAMASSFITVTEAKNVALQKLDIHSAFTPDELATGTGTDQIIMASGHGEHCTYVGGHTKIGEMIARAVTCSTVDAIRKSANGYFGH